jgi:hypothetical protein
VTVTDFQQKRLRCLAILPAPATDAHGGDEIVYRRSLAYLERTMDVETCHIRSVGKVRRMAGILGGNPPEATRYISRGNRRLVAERLAAGRVDVVVLCNEVTFPMLPSVKRAGVPVVLSAHNVHSIVAATDPSRLARMLRPCAVAFERRWYGDPYATLVLISQGDRIGLEAAGIRRQPVWISPPGVPPVVNLPANATLLREAVITGSYGWWRKRRDLTDFCQSPGLGVPIFASDDNALAILGEEAEDLRTQRDFSWSAGVRFGLITDAFLGGFKLKSLEYVAKNCILLSRSNIALEFAGLPHAEEFVRITPTKADMIATIREISAQPQAATVERFRLFKQACVERYDWDLCLAPFADAVRAAAGSSPAHH